MDTEAKYAPSAPQVPPLPSQPGHRSRGQEVVKPLASTIAEEAEVTDVRGQSRAEQLVWGALGEGVR